jgi:hypothetical protein
MRIHWLVRWAAAEPFTDWRARWSARQSRIAAPADIDADGRRIRLDLDAIRARFPESA